MQSEAESKISQSKGKNLKKAEKNLLLKEAKALRKDVVKEMEKAGLFFE